MFLLACRQIKCMNWIQRITHGQLLLISHARWAAALHRPFHRPRPCAALRPAAPQGAASLDGPLYAADVLAHIIAASAVLAHMQQSAATAQTGIKAIHALHMHCSHHRTTHTCWHLPPPACQAVRSPRRGRPVPCCAVAVPLQSSCCCQAIALKCSLVWHPGLRGRQGAECCRQERAAICADHRATACSGWVIDGCYFW